MSPRGTGGNRRQICLVSSSRHRCCLAGLPQRVGGACQATVCLTSTLALLASIICAVAFIGYAAFHRLQAGPGVTAPAIAKAAMPTVHPVRTLVSTFAPTRQPEPGFLPQAAPASTDTATTGLTPFPEPTSPTEPGNHRPPATSPPTRLMAPDIGLNAPVGPVGIKTVGHGASARMVWDDLPDAAGFHEASAYPGNPGNTVINGHRDIYAAVFRHPDRVEVGDEIILHVGSVAYPYQVTGTLVVPEVFATAGRRAENR